MCEIPTVKICEIKQNITNHTMQLKNIAHL